MGSQAIVLDTLRAASASRQGEFIDVTGLKLSLGIASDVAVGHCCVLEFPTLLLLLLESDSFSFVDIDRLQS